MLGQPWVMSDSHPDFSWVWSAYGRWRDRAQQLGFDPDRAVGMGCIGHLKRFGVLVRIDLSEADLNDPNEIPIRDWHWLTGEERVPETREQG